MDIYHEICIFIHIFCSVLYIGFKEIHNREADAMKKKLFGMLEKNIVTPDDYHSDAELYYAFISVLGRKVMRDSAFKTNIPDNKDNFKHWFNARDEAMAFLLLDNGMERWNAEIDLLKQKSETDMFWTEKIDKNDEKKLPLYKYTQRKIPSEEESESSIQNDGWKLEGISMYKEFLKKINKFRHSDSFGTFADTVINLAKENFDGKSIRKRKLMHASDENEIEKNKKLRELLEEEDMNFKFDDTDTDTDDYSE